MALARRSFGSASSSKAFHPSTLLLLASIWIATVGNAALWVELQKMGRLQSGPDLWLAICLGVIAGSALVLMTAWLAWRRSIKPLLVFLLLATALGLHFMLSYGVVIDPKKLAVNEAATLARRKRARPAGKAAKAAKTGKR